MAAYEFKCTECGTEFEINLPHGRARSQRGLPKCGSHEVEQKFSRRVLIAAAGQVLRSRAAAAPARGRAGPPAAQVIRSLQ